MDDRTSELQRQINQLRSQASVEVISAERLRHEYHELLHSSKLKVDISDTIANERETWTNRLRELAVSHRKEQVGLKIIFLYILFNAKCDMFMKFDDLQAEQNEAEMEHEQSRLKLLSEIDTIRQEKVLAKQYDHLCFKKKEMLALQTNMYYAFTRLHLQNAECSKLEHQAANEKLALSTELAQARKSLVDKKAAYKDLFQDAEKQVVTHP